MTKILRHPIIGSVFAIILAVLCGAVVLLIAGDNPVETYIGLVYGAVGRPRFIVNTVIAATPLILTGLSVTFAWKSGLFNIGVEGQFIIGTIAAVFLGHFLRLPPIIHPIVIGVGAMLAAGAFGTLVGFLKAKYNIHEVLSSIMLNWVALNIANMYVSSETFSRAGTTAARPIHDTAKIIFMYDLKQTPEGIARLRESAFLDEIVRRTDLNFGIIIAILAIFAVKFILDKTTLGYTLQAVGANKDAAEFAGIGVKKYICLSMFISGAIAGLAGGLHIMGVTPNTINMMGGFQNYGFNGLAVALLTNASVVGNIFSAIFIGGMRYGSGYIQSSLGVNAEIIDIMIGLILFFVALRAVWAFAADRLERRKRK